MNLNVEDAKHTFDHFLIPQIPTWRVTTSSTVVEKSFMVGKQFQLLHLPGKPLDLPFTSNKVKWIKCVIFYWEITTHSKRQLFLFISIQSDNICRRSKKIPFRQSVVNSSQDWNSLENWRCDSSFEFPTLTFQVSRTKLTSHLRTEFSTWEWRVWRRTPSTSRWSGRHPETTTTEAEVSWILINLKWNEANKNEIPKWLANLTMNNLFFCTLWGSLRLFAGLSCVSNPIRDAVNLVNWNTTILTLFPQLR